MLENSWWSWPKIALAVVLVGYNLGTNPGASAAELVGIVAGTLIGIYLWGLLLGWVWRKAKGGIERANNAAGTIDEG